MAFCVEDPMAIQWGGWELLGKLQGTDIGRPFVQRNQDGRLEVSRLVGRNADGREEIFALGGGNVLWQKWQVAPNKGWSDWKTLGTPGRDISLTLTDQFTVGRKWQTRDLCRRDRRKYLADLANIAEQRL
jgi:hypothetical protein